MQEKNVQIVKCKIGKTVSVDYLNHKDGRSYNVEDEELPHPDMKEALLAFREDLAGAYLIMNADTREKFVPNGFVVHENEESSFVTVVGKFETAHGDMINVNSGKIPVEEGKEVAKRILNLRRELYMYLFDGKCSQQKIPFEEK